ncbi:MAG: hypothetical protein DWQ04_23185 [Chloroflexi bacterium]|nr:MAG: hypothetical protein DWQ04_23185 [Chloroflexota bacterium]
MNEDELFVIWSCGIMGIFTLVSGILIRTGKYKTWWFLKSSPVTPIGIAYVAIPASIFFFMIPTYFFVSDPKAETIWTYAIGGYLIFVVFLSIWRPRWLVPKWLCWLEDNYEYLIPLLREDAIRMGERTWARQVNTQETLEKWAKEVWQKNKFDHPDPRFIGKHRA